MYVEKRETNGKIKYFLTHSYREGEQVHKFRKYLGQDLKPNKLRERKEIAEKLILEEIHKYNIIMDPLQVELSEEEINSIKKIEEQIPLKIKHLSEKDWRVFSELFTYNTNAIEGSRLDKKEVKDLLEKDKWPNKSKEDIAEAFGVDDAIQHIRKTKSHVSIELIKEIHKIVFKNSKSFAGKLRKRGEEVVVMGSRGNVVHEGAPQTRINHLLNELVKWYAQKSEISGMPEMQSISKHEKNKNKYPGLVLAAVVHNQFENIHPFADGNGRVGRILLNNILIKHNLPPININFKNRFEYYDTLQAYENKQDLKPTIDLFLKEYKSLKKQLGDHKNKRL